MAPVPGSDPWFPLLDRALYTTKTLQGLEESEKERPEAVPRAHDEVSSDLFSTDIVSPDDDDLMGDMDERSFGGCSGRSSIFCSIVLSNTQGSSSNS